MIFEQLIKDAKFEDKEKKNLHFEVVKFYQNFVKQQKAIYKEFLKMGVFNNYAKIFAYISYTNMLEQLKKIDIKNNYDLDKLQNAISQNVVPFLKRDLLSQLSENHFKIYQHKNNLVNLDHDYETYPKNFKQVVESCHDYYLDKVNNNDYKERLKVISAKIKENRKTLKAYQSLINSVYNIVKTNLNKHGYYKQEIGQLEVEVTTLKEYEANSSKIEILNNKIAKLRVYEKKYENEFETHNKKLHEIYDENKIFTDKQTILLEEKSQILKQKIDDKQMLKLLDNLQRKVKHNNKASKDMIFE